MDLGKKIKIQKTIYNTYMVQETYIQEKKNKKSLKDFNHYVDKLDNSISRARTNIFNVVKFNKFDYFYTQTISSKYDRTDLKILINKFADITRYLRKKYPENQFYYCIIPEYHSDKKSWHVHGFLSKDYGLDSYINIHGFLELKHFDSIGWNSISKIRNYEACLKYSGAYITKDLASQRSVGEKLFYCSQGLIRSNVIDIRESFQIAPIHYDFKNQYVFKTEIDENKYYKFINRLDSDSLYCYF